MRGPTTHHARERASERLRYPLSAQRQRDILNRLRKGDGIDLSRGNRDRGRWYINDCDEPLVVVADAKKRWIVTIWRLQENTRAWRIVEAKLAPIREAEAMAAEEARLRRLEEERKAVEAARIAAEKAKRQAYLDAMGPVTVPRQLRRNQVVRER